MAIIIQPITDKNHFCMHLTSWSNVLSKNEELFYCISCVLTWPSRSIITSRKCCWISRPSPVDMTHNRSAQKRVLPDTTKLALTKREHSNLNLSILPTKHISSIARTAHVNVWYTVSTKSNAWLLLICQQTLGRLGWNNIILSLLDISSTKLGGKVTKVCIYCLTVA